MSNGLSVQKKFEIDFQESGHLGFLIKKKLAIFDLQVTPILPIKFQELAFLFSDGGHLGFLIGMVLAIFSYNLSYISFQVSSQLAFRSRSSKQIFKMARMRRF